VLAPARPIQPSSRSSPATRRRSSTRGARRPHACGKAVCWFKGSAGEHLAGVRELLPLLERHGAARPGYVAYEDAYQVAAVPFRDTGA
jgi:hypothetical protein